MSVTGWVVDIHGELIKRTTSPNVEELELDVGPTEALVLDEPSSMTARWNGAAWIERPASPGDYAEWGKAPGAWFDPRTVAEAKVARLRAMRLARDVAIYGGMVWDGSGFDSDERSQSVLMGLYVDSKEAGFEDQPWRLADNSWRVLTAADAAGVWAALRAHVKAQFTRFAVVEYLIEQATTQAAVDAVSWEI